MIAQLTVAPAVVYYMRNQMQGELNIMSQKVADYEGIASNSSILYDESQIQMKEQFSNDMKSAVSTYQQLYSGISRKIDKVISNAEKGAAFEEELIASMSALQGLASDIYELKKGGEVTKAMMEKLLLNMRNSTDILQIGQTKLGQLNSLLV